MVPATASESSVVQPVSAVSVPTASPPYPSISREEWDRLERAFNTYRRELPRLLREGHAQRFALIKDDEVLSVWDTYRDAIQAGQERFGAAGKFCINRVKPQDVERFQMLDAGKVLDLRRRPPCQS